MSLIFLLVAAGCAPPKGFDSSLKSIVKPYRFNAVKWELSVIPQELKNWITGAHKGIEDEGKLVTEYFSLVERIKHINSQVQSVKDGKLQGDLTQLGAELESIESKRSDLEDKVESIIAGHIKEMMAKEGIFNPLFGLKVHFPPMNFKLETPPHMLVISPRDRIDSIREVTLKQDISPEQKGDIEEQTDKLGVSSLVVELGGFGGTFPSFVINNASLRFTIDAAAEEYIHQYLGFTPLGFRYLLDLTGISRNYEVATIDETVASMVSKELGSLVIKKYYSDSGEQKDKALVQKPRAEAKETFDFNKEMREIRKAVDEYLARGEIEQAEQFMEQKRQELASKGYRIRKLNQAYFAFHGTYADSPTSISPIGIELKELRNKSVSLREFLDKASKLTSRQDLQAALRT